MKQAFKAVLKWGEQAVAYAALEIEIIYYKYFLKKRWEHVHLFMDAAPCKTRRLKTYFGISQRGYARCCVYVEVDGPTCIRMTLQRQNGAEWEAVRRWKLTPHKYAELDFLIKGCSVKKGAYRIHLERPDGDDFNSRVLTYPPQEEPAAPPAQK